MSRATPSARSFSTRSRRGDKLSHDAARLLEGLRQAGTDPDTLGDASLLDHRFEAVPASLVAEQFGDQFAAALGELPIGQWRGPVASTYGTHLVLVDDRTDSRVPALEEVRDVVRRDWANAQRTEASEKYYQALLRRYTVTVEPPQPVMAAATARPRTRHETLGSSFSRSCSAPRSPPRTKCARPTCRYIRPAPTPTMCSGKFRDAAMACGWVSMWSCRKTASRLGAPRSTFVDNAYTERWSVRRAGGLTGATIHIAGLAATMTDVLVRLERLDGTTQVTRLTPSRPSFVVEAEPTRIEVAGTYTRLGVEHILTGVDHLLYILAMLLLVSGWKRVVATMTAFTATHSLTLTAATLGWVHVPQPPVEACIALSIVFVAREIARSREGASGLTERWPWVISFTFGLLHGFGFAGALSEVGLPQAAIPVALLFFNVGVEIGQLLFVAAVVASLVFGRRALRRLRPPTFAYLPSSTFARLVPPYAIGGVAMFWVIQRIAGF